MYIQDVQATHYCKIKDENVKGRNKKAMYMII